MGKWKDRASSARNTSVNYAKRKQTEARGHSYGYDGMMYESTVRPAQNTVRAGANVVNTVTGSWNHLSWKLRGLVAFVIMAVFFFLPFGVFQYAGWALYLAFTWVVNSFYWLVATLINALMTLGTMGVDTIFQYITEYIGGTYTSLGTFTIDTGSLLDPDVFKPTEFDTRYLLQWIWESFGGTISDMWDYVRS